MLVKALEVRQKYMKVSHQKFPSFGDRFLAAYRGEQYQKPKNLATRTTIEGETNLKSLLWEMAVMRWQQAIFMEVPNNSAPKYLTFGIGESFMHAPQKINFRSSCAVKAFWGVPRHFFFLFFLKIFLFPIFLGNDEGDAKVLKGKILLIWISFLKTLLKYIAFLSIYIYERNSSGHPSRDQ